MAEQVTMWKCADGFTTYTQAEAIAYELKLALEKAVADMRVGKVVKDDGHVDAAAVNAIVATATAGIAAQTAALGGALAVAVVP